MLHLRNISKQYAALTVLDGVEIEARKGEFLVLLGPSGCGKSTLLSIIAGLEAPSRGEIRIDGEIVNELEPKDRDIAMVFQSYALYPGMSVCENMSFGMRVRGVAKSEREATVKRVSALLQLDQLLDRRPSQLSGGQRQRVAMGRALVRNPKIFLFDEPLSNLDAKLRIEMRTELKKLHRSLGATIVYVTHDQIEAMTLATKVVVMNGGQVQQIGTPQEVYDLPANLFVAGFVGSPPMNLFPVTLERRGAGLTLHTGQGASDVTFNLSGRHENVSLPSECIAGIRPEAFSQADVKDQGADNLIEVTIELVEPIGADTLVLFRLGGSEVVARLPTGCDYAGCKTSLKIDSAKILLYDKAGARLFA
jgi:multiple sugar transport system ATP-binding protein